MTPLRKRIILCLLLPLFGLIAVSVIYAALTQGAISEGRELITCAFKSKFHLYCPGCGGSRSLVALLSLDIVSSFILFPALPITVLILADLYIRAAISFIKNDGRYLSGFRVNLLILIPAVIILTFFVRNALLILFGIDPIGDILRL